MMRSAVVIYLILATLAGPRLCVCSGSVTAAPNTSSVPAESSPRSCGCCKTSSSASSIASQTPGQQRPDDPSAPCQCQCGKQDTATVRPTGRAVKSSVDRDGFPGPVHTQDVPYPARIPPASGFDHFCDLPFHTTHDLLFAFHRLRC